jgi:two-component system CheB/CheR fusion protein
MWNSQAEELWGLRSDEVRDEPFLRLEIGLPVEKLAEQIRACLRGRGDGRERVLEAHDRRGRAIQCRVSTSPLSGPDDSISGTILLMEPHPADGTGGA